MNDLDKQILQRICDENISPKSGKYFLALAILKIASATLLIIFASGVLALELYIIRAMSEETALGGSHNPIFSIATIATILAVALSIGFAVTLIRHLGRSYLYTVTSLAVLTGAVSVIIAHGFDITGANRSIDRFVMGSYLEPFIYHEYDIWMDPEDGRIAGTVETVLSSTTYAIRDLDGNAWLIEEIGHHISPGSQLKITGHAVEPDPVTLERVFIASSTKMWR
jgi:hypothetical protein